MDLGLQGLRALVGGASAGLGAGCAAALAGEGARVALAARPSERLATTAGTVGGVAVGVDLSAPDGPATAVERAVQELGGLDVLVVNGGGPPPGTFGSVDDDGWQQGVEGTLMAAVRLIRAALPHLRASAAPSITVVLSSSVRMPLEGLVTSNVLRPGLVGLIKSLASEIAPIRINGVAPGRIATGRVAGLDERRATAAGISADEVRRQAIARIPLGRYGTPEEFGRVVALLASSAMGYVTGAVVPVDGGLVLSLP
ncbi:SDR family oxidoreductase [Nakamurella endophytica]|uniref:Oxidoreductase n=1 Tax=Nakamurella endophytica TaxID=1748367 RepID=A0A917WDV9_9ACTN|nr:SDR family oxidoreductase [Nakamurella endophytica]GGL98125.1 oxidoreductase [Nakamurella endophytica]